MQVASKLAKSERNTWFSEVPTICNISESRLGLLAISTTYLMHKNVESLSRAMEYHNLGYKDITVLTYSTDMEFGSVRLQNTGNSSNHVILEPIYEFLKTDKFQRLIVGISHPHDMSYNPDVLLTHKYTRTEYDDFFLANKFTDDEQFALDNIILPATESLLSDGKHNYTHSYSYKEIMFMVQKLKNNQMEALNSKKLKKAQFDKYFKNNGDSKNEMFESILNKK